MSLINISILWPFHQWGIYIIEPFPATPGGLKFLIITVDYFTKWIEAEPLDIVMGIPMIKLMCKNIVTRFSTPRVLICKDGTQFEGIPFKERCEEK